MTTEETLATHGQELRRGTVVLAALASLGEPRYGYALLQHLARAGIEVEGNTLYPLLRRLEKQGLLVSEWNTDESRPRKFYALTTEGRGVLTALTQEWSALNTALTRLTARG
ncbi:PadR family transcriptional regulator [Ornithinimicrobium cavernae]|uniref:PadR family transcriptional regulator n=1 Tax=Ornithinimicrobium cavernae TaxID=2666047 RepID=UPI000D68B8B6|nr:PadR family transcriptional regulator [Ornithinimicrobium cavernae]